jgi:dTDP-4-amino-4,6-dideoxy-D-galactose acyltransferase
MLEKLHWDSDFFDYPVYKLKLDNQSELHKHIDNLLKTDFKLTYIYSNVEITDESSLPKTVLLKLVDKKITYSLYPIRSVYSQINIINNSVYQKQISNLCIQSGEYSRFKVDDNFVNKEFEKLYQVWGENALNDKNKTILAELDDKKQLLGLAIVSIQDVTLSIEIIAVNKEYRKKGIGRALMNQINHFCTINKCNSIDVVTQLENHIACSFYQKNGFSIKNQTYIYHLWKKNL